MKVGRFSGEEIVAKETHFHRAEVQVTSGQGLKEEEGGGRDFAGCSECS